MFAQRKRPRLALVSASPTDSQQEVYAHPVPPPVPETPTAVALDDANPVDVSQNKVETPVVAEPLLDAFPKKIRERRRTGPISPFLVKGGNYRVWQSLSKLIATEKCATIMLHGSHGCGKTRGVRDLALEHLGMTVYELNSSNVEGVERFARDVRHVTRTKTLLGPRLLLIDDLDGFDDTYIAKMVELLKSRVDGDGPMVITCHNPFDRSLVKLRTLTMHRIRMYDPRPADMTAAVKAITNHSHTLVYKYATECRHNYHQLFIRLKIHAQSTMDIPVGFLDTTQALLRREVDTSTWMRAGESRMLITLLQENAPAIAGRGNEEDELERCCRFLDTVSATMAVPEEPRVDIVGRVAQIDLFTMEVPPLRLSKEPVTAKPGRFSERYILGLPPKSE